MEQRVVSTLNQLLDVSLLCGFNAEVTQDSSSLKVAYMNLSIRLRFPSNF